MIKRIINNKISIEREEMPDAIPYHIRHEYERFCSMIEDEQYAGAWFELRDLVEVTLKFPVLLGLSYMFQKESIDFENREVKNILELLLTKRLSLGDWKQLAFWLYECRMIWQNVGCLCEILKSVYSFVHNNQIIQWRNDMIGHGALPFEESNNFTYALRNIFNSCEDCLIECIQAYKKIEIQEDNNTIRVVIDNKSVTVERWIFEKEFFFDKYITTCVTSLNYLNGHHKLHNCIWFDEVYRRYQDYQRINGLKNIKLLNDTATWRDVMDVQRINQNQDYVGNTILMNWLRNQMKKRKGIHLIMADRGMGKTAFVSSLNQLFDGRKNDEWYVRVYYCSGLKFQNTKDFIKEFNGIFKIEENSEVFSEISDLKETDGSKEVAVYLKKRMEQIRNIRGNGEIQLLFIVDGIDEINKEKGKKNIFDFIPKCEQLEEGIHILLTSRNGDSEGEALPEYICEQLRIIKNQTGVYVFNFSILEEKNKIKYQRLLRKYIKKSLETTLDIQKKQFEEECSEEFLQRLYKISNWRFSDFKLYVELIKEAYKKGKSPEDYINGYDAMDSFFGYMQSVLGEKLYKMAGRILLIIATAYQPLRIEDCIFLERLSPGGNVVEVVAVLKMFESLFIYKRREYGVVESASIKNDTIVTYANEKYRKVIINKFQGMYMDELLDQWIDYINIQYQKEYILKTDTSLERRYNPETDYSFYKIYLHAYIYRYVCEFSNNKVLKNKIQKYEFIDALFQYEKFMATKELGAAVTIMDMEMSMSCIKLLEEQGMMGDRLLAASYNNYLFHRRDIFLQDWGTGSTAAKAIEEKENILDCFDKAICILQGTDIAIMDLHAKLCALKGGFLQQQGGNLEEVEELQIKSYRMMKELLKKNVLSGCNTFIQSVIRVLSVWGKMGKINEIEKLFRKEKEKLAELKEIELIQERLLVNANNRIEYGIWYQEAMLYRKMADICQFHKTRLCGETADHYYEDSSNILKMLEKKKVTALQRGLISENFALVLREYGRYEHMQAGNIEKAVHLYDRATEKIKDRVESGKTMPTKEMIEACYLSVELDSSIDKSKDIKYTQRVNLCRKWTKILYGMEEEEKWDKMINKFC